MGGSAVIRHPFDHDDAHLPTLKAELSARLGYPIELLTSEPTDADPAGVLLVEDPITGEQLDVDPSVVAAVVAEHLPPSPPITPEALALVEFDAAGTVAARLAVFRSYLERSVGSQAAAQARLRSDRERRRQERRAAFPRHRKDISNVDPTD